MKPLEADLRKMMSPNTASNLRESKRNSMRDFVDLAGPLGVTHFFLLSATAGASYLRLARAPRGPTLALRYMKDNLDDALGIDYPTAMHREAERLTQCSRTADHKEAVTAFVEKRKPVFTGR